MCPLRRQQQSMGITNLNGRERNDNVAVGCRVVDVVVCAIAARRERVRAVGGAGADDGGRSHQDRQGAGKLTLRHGPILNLDMQGMTMAFRVSDPVMLDTLQVGDTVRFVAERVNGVILLTRIEK